MGNQTQARALILLEERPIAALLSKEDDEGRLEASGVAVQGDHFYVVFDNVGHIARLRSDLSVNPAGSVWQGRRGQGHGYEALTWSGEGWFAAIEAVKAGKKRYQARVHAFDPGFRLLSEGPIDFDFKRENKGVEGLAAVQVEGRSVLLALCEAPAGSKKRGRSGQVLVLEPKGDGGWSVRQELKLPGQAGFEDFSDISIDHEGTVAVVSQEDSALWLGRLNTRTWTFEEEGEVFSFPTDKQGKLVYGNVEGVSWWGPRRVVVVSDRSKSDQPARCRTKEQSVHIFAIP